MYVAVCVCVCLCMFVHACECVLLSHAGQAAVCATMLCDCTAVSINLDSKGSDPVCLSSFLQNYHVTFLNRHSTHFIQSLHTVTNPNHQVRVCKSNIFELKAQTTDCSNCLGSVFLTLFMQGPALLCIGLMQTCCNNFLPPGDSKSVKPCATFVCAGFGPSTSCHKLYQRQLQLQVLKSKTNPKLC